MISGRQLRAARALLGLDQQELAMLARVSVPTIRRIEAAEGTERGAVKTIVKVIGALEREGIELLADNGPSTGLGRGVRLREPR